MNVKLFGLLAAFVVVFGLGMYIAISNWQECRTLHTFMYCATYGH